MFVFLGKKKSTKKAARNFCKFATALTARGFQHPLRFFACEKTSVKAACRRVEAKHKETHKQTFETTLKYPDKCRLTPRHINTRGWKHTAYTKTQKT